MKIKVAYVDDKPRLLQVMSEALAMFDEVEMVFTARNGQEALDKLAGKAPFPDVILMDIEMDGIDGITATREIREILPEIKIIMLTVFDDSEKIFEAILAGASGYLMKDEKPSKVVAAIEDAMEGRAPMSPVIAMKTLDLLRSQRQAEINRDTPQDFGLTSREIQILEEISLGLTYQKIAEKLFISPKTVRNHIENIYKKLHVHSKVEAVQLAMKNKWFEEGDG